MCVYMYTYIIRLSIYLSLSLSIHIYIYIYIYPSIYDDCLMAVWVLNWRRGGLGDGGTDVHSDTHFDGLRLSPSPRGGFRKGDPTMESPQGHFQVAFSTSDFFSKPPFRIPFWWTVKFHELSCSLPWVHSMVWVTHKSLKRAYISIRDTGP